MRRVVYCNRMEAEATEPAPGWVVVSITNPDSEPARLKAGWEAVHRTQFWDTDGGRGGIEVKIALEKVPINPHQAECLAVFLWEHRECNILVHCEAGQSRSRAVALAVWEVLGHDLLEVEGAPGNMRVYRMVHTVLNVLAGKMERGADEDE